jgi:hypothetical protein
VAPLRDRVAAGFLKDDIKRLREGLSEVRERTWKVENWQNLVPFADFCLPSAG